MSKPSAHWLGRVLGGSLLYGLAKGTVFFGALLFIMADFSRGLPRFFVGLILAILGMVLVGYVRGEVTGWVRKAEDRRRETE